MAHVCVKTKSWTLRKDARENMLARWARGDFRVCRTHWCDQHRAYHLTSQTSRGGRDWNYKD